MNFKLVSLFFVAVALTTSNLFALDTQQVKVFWSSSLSGPAVDHSEQALIPGNEEVADLVAALRPEFMKHNKFTCTAKYTLTNLKILPVWVTMVYELKDCKLIP